VYDLLRNKASCVHSFCTKSLFPNIIIDGCVPAFHCLSVPVRSEGADAPQKETFAVFQALLELDGSGGK